MSRRRTRFGLLVICAILASANGLRADRTAQASTSPASAASAGTGLPDGPGADITARRCLTCHEADLISQQRLSESGWDRELAKMSRWGATLADDERAIVLQYLTRTFGPKPTWRPSDGVTAEGERLYRAACLSCHGEDLSAQQRLTRAGWIREIDKMVRWGAVVTDAQKAPLADFLTARWGRP